MSTNSTYKLTLPQVWNVDCVLVVPRSSQTQGQSLIIVAIRNGDVHVYNSNSDNREVPDTKKIHNKDIKRLVLLPPVPGIEYREVASCSVDKSVKIWRIIGHELIFQYEFKFDTGVCNLVKHGSIFYFGRSDNRIEVRSEEISQQKLYSHPGDGKIDVNGLHLFPDPIPSGNSANLKTLLVSTNSTGHLCLWKISNNQRLHDMVIVDSKKRGRAILCSCKVEDNGKRQPLIVVSTVFSRTEKCLDVVDGSTLHVLYHIPNSRDKVRSMKVFSKKPRSDTMFLACVGCKGWFQVFKLDDQNGVVEEKEFVGGSFTSMDRDDENDKIIVGGYRREGNTGFLYCLSKNN